MASRTYSFIGSDKNAGKTTAILFVLRELRALEGRVCLTSVGINGEETDAYEGGGKPAVRLPAGTFFVTSAEHLKDAAGSYRVRAVLAPPSYSKTYVLGESLRELRLLIEGPNSGEELLAMKRELEPALGPATLLIDGSIDRQFLADPAISDGFYYALLLSDRLPQIRKAGDLLAPLSFPACAPGTARAIEAHRAPGIKSLLLGPDGGVLHRGTQIPFLDEALKRACAESRGEDRVLYLNGSLSRSLLQFLAPMERLEVVLDNFTLYQNVGTDASAPRLRARVSLLRPLSLRKIFVRRESEGLEPFAAGIPAGVPVHDLFRDGPWETHA